MPEPSPNAQEATPVEAAFIDAITEAMEAVSALDEARVVIQALRDRGYRIVHPEHMADDCLDRWTCCIHEPPKDES